MNRDPRLYIDDILESIAVIATYVDGVTEEDYHTNQLLQDGIVRRLEIIGEAVRQLPQPIRDLQPAIPWLDIAGMRNRITHHYFGIDLNRVWTTVQQDLPPLKQQMQELLHRLGD